ncbi:MAG: nucleotidyltransferase domain-containing protein [Syntrophomonadaceae bacterium]|nr:nucleotidyltransferase domain-containing protein [Syntrophomonadaceae bacterium]
MSILITENENLNQYEVIPLITDMIVKKIAPQKIILFGSCAKRCITRESDIDLCIIMEGQITAPKRTQIRRDLLKNFLEITDYEVDLIICGEDEWQRNYKNAGVMIGKISLEGDLLYGR